ncbi:hypothetical protein [Paenibacillus eucommiae]|uniref:Lipoprotein n=1 Tax=Paenibacillus eucommiae TaxID=1355755 RepID=A0ABS4IXR2_9BACL|nr:hypothetical protein [Paenibacillus eucommiae]MBP1992378.1 hypothetical protein [Paenibacillus eucommiae]
MHRLSAIAMAMVISISLTACSAGTLKMDQAGSQGAGTSVTPAAPLTEEESKTIIENRIKETIEAFQLKDMKKITAIVHPEKGVQFSPYAHIDPDKDVRVQAGELEELWNNTAAKKVWGQYDGSGEPIELSFADYYQKFIYDHDYVKAPKIGYNKTLGVSTTVNNIFTLYPKDSFITVEYHFEGFDKQYAGMDWASLRLVYEYNEGELYLVAVVHDQWTT